MLLVGVGRHQGGVHREALAANQTFLDATADDGFKNMPEGAAFSEAAVAVLRKCGMVWDFTFQAEPTKPTVGKIEMGPKCQRRHRSAQRFPPPPP
jgi:hypothetical protein